MSSKSDVKLVGDYLSGDTEAFDQLFSRYHTRIKAASLRQLRDEDAAEDIVQETFFHVLRSLHQVSEDFNFGGWIHRIATNLCHDEQRRRNRRAARGEKDDESNELALLALVDPDGTSRPEKALELSSLRRVVWDVAKELPERQRMVLTLRELQGLSYSAIAGVMGTSESAVETLLHRARRRFRDEFMKLESPDEEPGPCAVVARIMGTPLDQLDPAPARTVASHLASCAWCRNLYPSAMETLAATA